VRRGDQAELFEIGHHVAQRGRAQAQTQIARQRLAADRPAVGHVMLDQPAQQALGAFAEGFGAGCAGRGHGVRMRRLEGCSRHTIDK
jgi:hypothetical protein